LFGCRTHTTIWSLERIITPSITACPPKAKDGSFCSLVVKLISERRFYRFLYAFAKNI
jgi:hypothetical protein